MSQNVKYYADYLMLSVMFKYAKVFIIQINY